MTPAVVQGREPPNTYHQVWAIMHHVTSGRHEQQNSQLKRLCRTVRGSPSISPQEPRVEPDLHRDTGPETVTRGSQEHFYSTGTFEDRTL